MKRLVGYTCYSRKPRSQWETLSQNTRWMTARKMTPWLSVVSTYLCTMHTDLHTCTPTHNTHTQVNILELLWCVGRLFPSSYHSLNDACWVLWLLWFGRWVVFLLFCFVLFELLFYYYKTEHRTEKKINLKKNAIYFGQIVNSTVGWKYDLMLVVAFSSVHSFIHSLCLSHHASQSQPSPSPSQSKTK